MLKNRCAIVTGSVAGLGYAIAESLGKAARMS
jgi:NAD(P)-dependent dehydrogenase (short-subunit alcohol dehydrogenase family)